MIFLLKCQKIIKTPVTIALKAKREFKIALWDKFIVDKEEQQIVIEGK